MEQKKNRPAVRFRGFHDEWKNDILGNQVDFFTGLTYSPNDVSDKGTFVIRSSNIKENRLVKTDNVFVNSDVVNCEYVKKNDIVVVVRNGSRELIGKHAQLKKEESNTVIGAFMTGIRCDESNFLTALLDTNQFKSKINENLGATINQITTGNFKNMEFGFPNSKPEQTKIGSFFENLDHLLSKHQTQHQKLKALKKAMLGKLFPKQGATVPEIRFKGFTGDWEVKTLGEVGSTFTGLSGKTKEDFGHGKGRFVTYMNVFTNAISDKNLIEPIEIDNSQNEVLKGDVFFTTSSETAEEVGMSSVWMEEKSNIYLNSFCFGYRPKIELDNYYLANMLRSNVFRKKITFLAQGISRYNISKNKVMNLEIQVPSLKEQQRIGNYFKNLDQLITKHATQIEKLSAIKKACLSKMFV